MAPPQAQAPHPFGAAAPGHPEGVRKFFAKESRSVGRVDPDPARTRERLAERAASLSPPEMEWLATQALNVETGADGRFLATYLLAMNGQAAAIGPLFRIAMSRVPSPLGDRRQADEVVLRMQAIEGLSRIQSTEARDLLQKIAAGHAIAALRDRAHRALYAWETGKPVEDQDKAALRSLLGS